MSRQELKACLLALYHPDLFDLHEQKILHPYSERHPLHGLHATQQLVLPDFRGTVDVCIRLGIEHRHPTVYVENDFGRGHIPFPYLGDLLLFIDPLKPRVINWSIKLSNADFKTRRRGFFSAPKSSELNVETLDDRHTIEKTYYDDVAITTHRIAGQDIDDQVYFNLQDLFDSLLDVVPLDIEGRRKASAIFSEAVESGTKGYSVLEHVQRTFKLTRSQTSALFRQEIWYRRVRIDLFQPLDRSRRLRRESHDVLDIYSRWFEA